MANLEVAWENLKRLDNLATRNTVIQRLHPVVKLLTALVFIITVASFRKYDLVPLLPLILYPIVLITLGELPWRFLLKSILLALPFILFIAIFNPLLDRATIFQLGQLSVSGGWVSFLTLMLRFALTVIAALTLVATSGLNEIGAALLKLKVPKPFVLQLLLLYRYLNVLIAETIRSIQAYSLRSLSSKGLAFRVWGSLIGQLLLRTVDRAQRIYHAMLCRGFNGEIRLVRSKQHHLA